MAGKRRRPVERAVIYAGVLGGLTIEQINELLADAGLPATLGDSTYKSIQRNEVPVWLKEPSRLGEHIYKPQTRGDLSDDDDDDHDE